MPDWWNRQIDRWVRVESRKLSAGALWRRKLLHTAQIVGVWPLLVIERRWIALALILACSFVVSTQRRVPYASLALLTLLTFAGRLVIGGAWVIFTAGDGMAALIGRPAGKTPLPWNSRKTWAGSFAFVFVGSAALLALMRWYCDGLPWPQTVAVVVATATTGGAVESLPVPLDDNYTVIVASGLVLHVLLPVLLARAG